MIPSRLLLLIVCVVWLPAARGQDCADAATTGMPPHVQPCAPADPACLNGAETQQCALCCTPGYGPYVDHGTAFTSTCNAGAWSPPFDAVTGPTDCVFIPLPCNLGAPTGPVVFGNCSSTVTPDSYCELGCQNGYARTAFHGGSCNGTSGLFIGGPPTATCTAVTCSASPVGVGVTVGTCGSVNQGSTCQFGCNSPYVPINQTPSGTCNAGVGPTASFASPPSVSCQLKCFGNVTLPAHVTNGTCGPAPVLPNQSCQLNCTNGYIPSGASTATCDGTVPVFTPPPLITCTAAVCSASPPANALVNTCTNVALGGTCQFSCQANYFPSAGPVNSGACVPGVGPVAVFATAPTITCTVCPSCAPDCTAFGYGTCNCGNCVCTSGHSGTGCLTCTGTSVYGLTCSTTCPCQHGACNNTVFSGGECTACDAGTGWKGSLCNSCDPAWTGAGCNQCASGFFGATCAPCLCNLAQGTCAGGISGTGDCSSCLANFFGSDCESTCLCQHGTCSNGPSGTGDCTSCQAGYHGADCDKNCTCVHGTCNDGINGDGTCLSCQTGWAGTNCNIQCQCVNGICNGGIHGDGHCASCTPGAFFFGTDCDTACNCQSGAGTCDESTDQANGGHCLACDTALLAGEDCQIACDCTNGHCDNGITGTGECASCNGGYKKFSNTECTACIAGQYAADGNTAASCQTCDAGTITATDGLAACSPCVPGTIAATGGLSSCSNCPAGQSSTAAASGCTVCDAGYANPDEGGNCTACVDNTVSRAAAATTCVECAAGGKPNAAHTSCTARQGYKVSTLAAQTFIQCPVEEACCESGDCGPNCNEVGATAFYTGDLCQGCAGGAYSPNNDGHCVACPSLSWAYIAVAAVVLVALCFILVRAAKSATFYFNSITVAFNFFQLTSVLASFDLEWPPVVVKTFGYLSVFYFNIDIIQVDCLSSGGMDYELKWKLKLLLPVALLLIFFLIFLSTIFYKTGRGLGRACGCCQKKNLAVKEIVGADNIHHNAKTADIAQADNAADTDFGYASINAALSMLSVFYTLMIVTSMEIFDCIPANTVPSGLVSTAANPSRLVIRRGPLIDCYASQWYTLRSYAFLGLGAYGIGIPLIFVSLLYSNRKILHHEGTVASFGLLYRRYVPQHYMWELVVMYRKIGVVAAKFLNYDAVYQLAVITFVILTATVAQIWKSPYSSKRVNRLETLSITCSFLVLVAGLAFYLLSGNYGAGYISGSAYADLRNFGGYAVVALIIVFSAGVVYAVIADLAYMYNMKAHGAIGCYLSDAVQISQHFFDSQFSFVSTREYITTTNMTHDIVIHYEAFKKTEFRVALKATIRRDDLGKFRFKPVRGSDYQRQPNKHDVNQPCKFLLQHDRISREYHVDMLFYEAGRYTLLMSGGKKVEKQTCACECDLTTIREARRIPLKDAWHPRRQLLSFSTEILQEITAHERQDLVDVTALNKFNCVLFKPTHKYLVHRDRQTFRIRVYNAQAVFIVHANNQRTRLYAETDVWRTEVKESVGVLKFNKKEKKRQAEIALEVRKKALDPRFKVDVYSGEVPLDCKGPLYIEVVWELERMVIPKNSSRGPPTQRKRAISVGSASGGGASNGGVPSAIPTNQRAAPPTGRRLSTSTVESSADGGAASRLRSQSLSSANGSPMTRRSGTNAPPPAASTSTAARRRPSMPRRSSLSSSDEQQESSSYESSDEAPVRYGAARGGGGGRTIRGKGDELRRGRGGGAGGPRGGRGGRGGGNSGEGLRSTSHERAMRDSRSDSGTAGKAPPSARRISNPEEPRAERATVAMFQVVSPEFFDEPSYSGEYSNAEFDSNDAGDEIFHNVYHHKEVAQAQANAAALAAKRKLSTSSATGAAPTTGSPRMGATLSVPGANATPPVTGRSIVINVGSPGAYGGGSVVVASSPSAPSLGGGFGGGQPRSITPPLGTASQATLSATAPASLLPLGTIVESSSSDSSSTDSDLENAAKAALGGSHVLANQNIIASLPVHAWAPGDASRTQGSTGSPPPARALSKDTSPKGSLEAGTGGLRDMVLNGGGGGGGSGSGVSPHTDSKARLMDTTGFSPRLNDSIASLGSASGRVSIRTNDGGGVQGTPQQAGLTNAKFSVPPSYLSRMKKLSGSSSDLSDG